MRSSSKEDIQKQLQSTQGTFSPQNTQQFSSIFNQRGPVRPQNLLMNTSASNNQSSDSRPQKVQLPSASDFVKADGQQQLPLFLNSTQQQQMRQQQMQIQYQQQQNMLSSNHNDDEYDDEDGDYEEEEAIFLKVLDILTSDPELKPLIFEHQTLLNSLIDMKDLKAEWMLSILTAAETEMYESSRQKEELQVQNHELQQTLEQLRLTQQRPITETKQISARIEEPNENTITTIIQENKELMSKTQTAEFEIDQLKKELFKKEQENLEITQELERQKELRERIEREKECTFKNLYDECQQLKKLTETLKKTDQDQKHQIQEQKKLYQDELEKLRQQVKEQEDLRMSMLHNKSKIEIDLERNDHIIKSLEREIQLLEKENNNLHRKLNNTLNSILFQSQINHTYLNNLKFNQDNTQNLNFQDENNESSNSPARRNLSESFQINDKNSDIKNQQQLLPKSSLLQNPLIFPSNSSYNPLQNRPNAQNNNLSSQHSYISYGMGGVAFAGQPRERQTLVRSNSIEVILLEDEESKKQNYYAIGEEDKRSNYSAVLTNKQSWLKTKGIFTDLSPINSIQSSHQRDPSTSRINQSKLKKLHDVQEENEVLGTNPNNLTNPARYYEEQVKKLQQEIDKLREENQNLTQKINTMTQNQFNFYGQNIRTDETPGKSSHAFATPQNTQFGVLDGRRDSLQQNNPILMTNNMNQMFSNEQSPALMATFSQEKDRQFYSHQYIQNKTQFQSQQSSVPKNQYSESEREKFLEQQYEKLAQDFMFKIQEIGTRLLQLFRKFQPQHNEINSYISQEFSVSLIKDLIYDISNKFDFFVEHQQKSLAFFSQNASSNNPNSGGIGLNPFFNTNPLANPIFQNYMPQSYSGGGGIMTTNNNNQNNTTTLDGTPTNSSDLKNLLLEEKEKRLMVQEELQKTRENISKFQTECERLKRELENERSQSQNLVMSNFGYQTQEYDIMMKNLQSLQAKIDQLQDENVSLKLNLSQAESELLDERSKQQIKYDFTLENLKNNMSSQYLEYKIHFEEQMMSVKSQNQKLEAELRSALDRNSIIKEQLVEYRQRIQELEKDNLNHFKENYVLQNELDYETIRASQIQKKQDVTRHNSLGHLQSENQRLEDKVSKLEFKVKDLQFECSNWEHQAKKTEDMAELSKIRYLDEIKRLSADNQKLLEQLQQNRGINTSQVMKSYFDKFNINQQSLNQERKISAIKIAKMLIMNNQRRKTKSFYQIWANAIVFNVKVLSQQKYEQFQSLSEVNEQNLMQRNQMLEEQLYKEQAQLQQMAQVIGKIIRQVNLRQPLKLNLSGVVSKLTLEYVMQGMKRNQEVVEFNVSKSDLDDEDLDKIKTYLDTDKGLEKLKFGRNNFTLITPILNMVKTKVSKLKHLDISYLQLNEKTLSELPKSINDLEIIEEINIAGIFTQELINDFTDKVGDVLIALLTLSTLKAIDMSKNPFLTQHHNILFYSLHNLKKLESLIISSIGINDAVGDPFVKMISNCKNLKKLNVSGNSAISSTKIDDLLLMIKKNNIIEDLDLSKCKIGSGMATLSELMMKNQSLRVLTLQKVELDDSAAYHLIKPLTEMLNLEILKLDYNQFSHVFVQKLSNNMITNRISQSISRNESESVLDNHSSTSSLMPTKLNRRQGLLSLSLEGNSIGDLGAKAVASLIQIPNDNTKSLRSVNLNQCDITNKGYDYLKEALLVRGNLTKSQNLSHVKITIDRNHIKY